MESKNKRLEVLREKNKNFREEIEVEVKPAKKLKKKEIN